MIHSIRPHKITSIVHRLDLGPVVDYTTDGIESREREQLKETAKALEISDSELARLVGQA